MSERKSILVVEDDDVARELMTLALTRNGYDVISAEDGIQGFELAREHGPDLIITDIYMPAADGIHLVRRVRDDDRIAATPIIVTSGAGVGTGIFSLAQGADAFERKPLDPAGFLATVARLLNPAEPGMPEEEGEN